MNTKEYQEFVQQTECNQQHAKDITNLAFPTSLRCLQSAMGLQNHIGEIAKALELWIWYGHNLDTVILKEELGDLLGFIAQMCNTLDFDLEEIMQSNIAKLKERYPEKFDASQDLDQHGHGFAELPEVDETEVTPHIEGWDYILDEDGECKGIYNLQVIMNDPSERHDYTFNLLHNALAFIHDHDLRLADK
jgi:NTP pyrophosphatase (non-canonical NTP hydrolase)